MARSPRNRTSDGVSHVRSRLTTFLLSLGFVLLGETFNALQRPFPVLRQIERVRAGIAAGRASANPLPPFKLMQQAG